MDPNHLLKNFKNKGQRGLDHIQERVQQLRHREQRIQKLTARTRLDLRKRKGHLGYTGVMLDLLRAPVSLGLKGGSRGYQR
jgi:hypothetical protein